MNPLQGHAVVRAALLIALCIATACSSSNDKPPTHATNLACDETTNPESASGYTLKPFCSPQDPGPGNIWFAASGEVLALTGYAFPPASDSDAAFVDGWDVRFSHLLTTLDKITLSENPDYQKGSQALTGKVVAEVDGPWAVDLSHGDARYLAGKGGSGEQAVPIAALGSQNKNGGEAFATDGTRYAFGFDVIAANDDAQNVNLDPEALADYQEMVSAGCAVLYVGTATFKGDPSFPGCVTDESKTWPKVVRFRLCFKSPTSYLNCQNPDNDPAKPISDDEESERGIAFLSNASVIGQVTLHSDHPFWDSVLHDSPAHFDQFAARAVDSASGALVTLDDTVGADFTAYTDALGNPVAWRYCVQPPTDVHPKLVGAMRFDPHGVPSANGSDPATGLRDYHDFATYNQSTQGHLNADGLCFVRRNYPSPN